MLSLNSWYFTSNMYLMVQPSGVVYSLSALLVMEIEAVAIDFCLKQAGDITSTPFSNNAWHIYPNQRELSGFHR